MLNPINSVMYLFPPSAGSTVTPSGEGIPKFVYNDLVLDSGRTIDGKRRMKMAGLPRLSRVEAGPTPLEQCITALASVGVVITRKSVLELRLVAETHYDMIGTQGRGTSGRPTAKFHGNPAPAALNNPIDASRKRDNFVRFIARARSRPPRDSRPRRGIPASSHLPRRRNSGRGAVNKIQAISRGGN